MTSELYLGSRSNDPEQKETLNLKYANRHGLIAGATGDGENRHLARLGRRVLQGRRACLFIRCQR